jgi:hypothetical protein
MRIVLVIACLMTGLLLAPVVASTILSAKGVYQLRVVALGPDGQPLSDTKLTPPPGGELKQSVGGWEFDISQQSKPADKKLTFYATAGDGALIGEATAVLGESFLPPRVTIHLHEAPYAMISGNVVDESGRSVGGASVSVGGLRNVAVTDEHGFFTLPTNALKGQQLRLRAEKGHRVAESHAVAGEVTELVLPNR